MAAGEEHIKLNQSKWDARSETYDEGRYDYFRDLQKRAVSLLPLKKDQKFLDIGCGTGWAVRYAAGMAKDGGEFYGIDVSSKMIEKAIENTRGHNNIFFYRASAEKLPFENDLFDSIICTNSFHHYPHPSKALDEVCRVLKPGGRIYIVDPTSDGLIVKLLDGYMKIREREHVKFYSSRDYRELFTRSGIKYIMTKTVRWLEKVHIGEK
jgi:ubiquinone/menaquinone biosynthesis C-methylase UbiE